MNHSSLAEPIYWQMTSLVHEVARDAMNHRSEIEMVELVQKNLLASHGEAIREYPELDRLIRGAFLFLRLIGHEISGQAVDMGSGTGVGATILSKISGIEKVYAVEMSEGFVKNIMPVVFQEFDANVSKIQRVVGDFNHLDLEEGSIDIVLEIAAFHHSENLDFTIKECKRVLRSGGVIFAIDRAWPDTYTQDRLEAMLDRELPDNLKRKYGISPSASFTRRDYGEHEYTIGQLLNAFWSNGFDATAFSQLHPPALNRLFLRIPTHETSLVISALLYRLGLRRLFIYGFSKTRKLFICVKK
jgi:SAM-dependent methyltransferase